MGIVLASKLINFAKRVSVITHPLLMPTYAILIIYFSEHLTGFNRWNIGADYWWAIAFIVLGFLMSFILPSIFVFYLKKKGIISAYSMPKKQERTLPFLFTGVCFLLFYYIQDNLFVYQVPVIVKLFLLGAVFSVLFAGLITVSWKISVHMIGIGGVCGIFFLMSAMGFPMFIHLLLAILTAGIIGFSRLILNAHQPQQVFAGFLLGFFSVSFYLFIDWF